MAFAYNKPTVLIETNVRTVFLHHCFPQATGVPDSALLPLIAASVPPDRVRDWYAALMDYGSYLKIQYGNASRRSRTYTKQSRFVGSNRQVRGAIVRALSATLAGYTAEALTKHLVSEGIAVTDISTQLAALSAEGMITKTKHRYHVPH
jgi:A/G-specific adenine glycosylase